MSVVSVTELFRGRTGKVDSQFRTSYKRVFDVIMSNVHDGPLTAMEAVAFSINETYSTSTEFDNHAVCTGLSASNPSTDGKRWEVEVEYGPAEPAFENPLDKPLELNWNSEKREKGVDFDINGEPLLNKAFDPFDPPVQVGDPRNVISIKRNEANDPRATAAAYRNTINDSEFLGYPERTVRLEDVKATRVWSANLNAYYFETEYEFHVDLNEWKARPVNQGLSYLDGDTKRKIMEGQAPVSSPKLLDESGGVLPDGAPGVVLEFEIYNTTSFDVF